MKFRIIYILVLFISFSCSKYSRVLKSGDKNEKYLAAKAYYEEEEYFKASELLGTIMPYIKGEEIADNALFILAMCQYQMEQYYLSSSYFREYHQKFARSEHVQDAMFYEAMSDYRTSAPYNLDQEKTYSAIQKFQMYMIKFPGSTHYVECDNIIKKLREKLETKDYENACLLYRMKDYKAAVVVLAEFVKKNSDSKYVEEADFKRLDAQYRLAKISVENKKKDRYLSAVEFYQEFIDKYPESEFNKKAENIYQATREALSKL